jgi:hypothetical protein
MLDYSRGCANMHLQYPCKKSACRHIRDAWIHKALSHPARIDKYQATATVTPILTFMECIDHGVKLSTHYFSRRNRSHIPSILIEDSALDLRAYVTPRPI